MPKTQKNHRLMATLRGFGYGSLILQWLWVLIVILPSVLKSGVLDQLLVKTTGEPPVTTPHGEASPLVLIIGGVVTLIILGITVYVLVRLPITIARTGDTVTETVSRTIVPLVVHHKPISPAKQKRLASHIMFYFQIGLCLLPVVALPFVPSIKDIPAQLVYFIESLLALVSVMLFSGAYALLPKHASKKRTA